MTITRNISVAAILISIATITPAAHANTKSVTYKDLDLASAHGRATLERRVEAASWGVCRFDHKGNLVDPRTEIACQRVARKDAAVKLAAILPDTRVAVVLAANTDQAPKTGE